MQHERGISEAETVNDAGMDSRSLTDLFVILLRFWRRYSPLMRAAVANQHCTMLPLLNQGVDVHSRDSVHSRCCASHGLFCSHGEKWTPPCAPIFTAEQAAWVAPMFDETQWSCAQDVPALGGAQRAPGHRRPAAAHQHGAYPRFLSCVALQEETTHCGLASEPATAGDNRDPSLRLACAVLEDMSSAARPSMPLTLLDFKAGSRHF